MKTLTKMVVYPALLYTLPQIPFYFFFIFARFMLGDSQDVRGAQVIVAGVLVAVSSIACMGVFLDEGNGLLAQMKDEVADERRKKEALRKAIDDQIGIPRPN